MLSAECVQVSGNCHVNLTAVVGSDASKAGEAQKVIN